MSAAHVSFCSCRPEGRRRRVRPLAALGLLAALAGVRPLAGQDVLFAHIGTGEGLASEWVLDIAQDRTGFMWFGTTNGLNRFDGRRMRVYRFRLDDPSSLPSNRVDAVHVDRAGTLWIGTSSGVSRYDPARDAFTNFLVEDSLPLPDRIGVSTILDDGAGGLWLGTMRGAYRFDPKTGHLWQVPLPWTGGTTDQALVLLQDDRGHVWFGSRRQGLADYDPRTRRFRIYANLPGQAGSFPSNDIRDAVQEPGGPLWIATADAGLVRLDPRTGAFQDFRHDPAQPNGPAADRILRLQPDGHGGLWLGTETDGVDYRDPAGRFHHYRPRALPGRPGDIVGLDFPALFIDRTGMLWAGSASAGLSRSLRSSAAIQAYLPIWGDSTTLASPSVLGFAEAPDGKLWIANGLGGLSEFDADTRRFRAHNAQPALNVLAVAADPDGSAWVGTWMGGLGHYDPRTGTFRMYNMQNSAIPGPNIFAVLVDRNRLVWAGTAARGLFSLDPRTGKVETYRIADEGQPQWQIWLIRQLQDGRLALGTLAHGLVLIDPRTGRRTSYLSSPDANSISSNDVRGLLETEPGVLWLGTGAGLDRLDLRTGTFTHFREADGLPSGLVCGLARDRTGTLWISSDRGVYRFDPRTRAVLGFGPEDGLQGRQFNPRSYLQARDGTLYFGGNRGFNAIRPELLALNPYRPPVVLTGLRLANRVVQPGAAGSPLRRGIEETRHLVLEHGQSAITLEFAALDFNAPDRNQYAYRLEGFDDRWTNAGTRGAATFTGLAPGDYVFRVRGSNGDGVWNEAGTSLRITIRPAFWQTWWFRVLVALLLVGAGLLALRIVRARQQRLAAINRQLEAAAERDRERQRELQGQVLDILSGMRRFATGETTPLPVHGDEAIRELRGGINRILADRRQAEAELRESQKMDAVGRLAGVVAHDFNNLLTVMQGSTVLALEALPRSHGGRRELEEVSRATERAGSLTRQLLAFSRKQVLQPRALSLNTVVRDLSRMLRRSTGEDVDFRLQLEDDVGWVYADPGQLEQALLNLVVNAREAMPRGGALTIATRRANPAELSEQPGWSGGPYVALSVSDTGIGIPPGVKEHIFEPFFTTKEAGHATGLGLSTVYGTVKQSGGFVHVDTAPGRGSTFTLYVPRIADEGEVPQPAEEPRAEPAAARRGSILLVEDEAGVRDLTARVLRAAGYSVLVADGGETAIRLADRRDPIDLLLTDVMMPGMTGPELATRVLQRHPRIRLLFTSGSTPDALEGSRPLGPRTAFLEKPFSPADLLRAVADLLHNGHNGRNGS